MTVVGYAARSASKVELGVSGALGLSFAMKSIKARSMDEG